MAVVREPTHRVVRGRDRYVITPVEEGGLGEEVQLTDRLVRDYDRAVLSLEKAMADIDKWLERTNQDGGPT